MSSLFACFLVFVVCLGVCLFFDWCVCGFFFKQGFQRCLVGCIDAFGNLKRPTMSCCISVSPKVLLFFLTDGDLLIW